MVQYFIFGALYPSKSRLMNKHIVKHIVASLVPKCRNAYRALYPSDTQTIVKHIVNRNFRLVGWLVGWLVIGFMDILKRMVGWLVWWAILLTRV